MSIHVQLDTREFEDRLDFASRESRNAMRRAVDKSARAARKVAIDTLAADIGVPKSQFKASVPPVKGSTQGSLSASWTIGKARIRIASVAGAVLPVRGVHGLTASTHTLTGGRSASLNVGKAFTIQAGNGATLVMVRIGKGRAAIKAIFGENPVAGMSQDDGAARKVWDLTASRKLDEIMRVELQLALDGVAGTDAGAGGE